MKSSIQLVRQVCFYLLITFLFTACTTGKKLGKKSTSFIRKQVELSSAFENSFTGLTLVDLESGEVLYDHLGEKYFTPASNTKILTLYTCLNILGDSIPALYYEVQGDSLFFWGSGDPSLLNPKLGNNRIVLDFLKSRSEHLIYCSGNFQDHPLGSGWAWDDYNYGFQAEKSAFPFRGNLVRFKKESNSLQYEVDPPLFEQVLQHSENFSGSKAAVNRRWDKNIFEYNLIKAIPYAYARSIPFRYSDALLVQMLMDNLDRPVSLSPSRDIQKAQISTLYSTATDEAYQLMMQHSDNFTAEQLLLICAGQTMDTLNTTKTINYAQRNFLQGLPAPMIWVDGSGISRYNLMTPQSIVEVLKRLYALAGEEYIKNIFPAGGHTGTIKNWYGEAGRDPYVFAKTGSLRNNHNLSGYLKAKSGKILAFSFMHNHFPGGSRPIKEEMQKLLREIHLKF